MTIAVLLAVCAACALLALLLAYHLVAGTLADERVRVSREALAASVAHFPDSPRLQARLALADLMAQDRDLRQAEFHAERAIKLSPYDYRFPLLLASIKESAADYAAAEAALRSSLALAPANADVRWRLSNFLLRQGRIAESLDEFRATAASRSEFLPMAFNLVWKASRGDVDALGSVAGNDARAQFALAQFLLKQSRPSEAAAVIDRIDHNKLPASDAAALLDDIIAAGQPATARDLWMDLKGVTSDKPLIWNGGFESPLMREPVPFDWAISASDYARIAIDSFAAHTGNRSLRIDFAGRRATRLDGEIKQLVVLDPGARYSLECYIKTEGVAAPEAPRIVLTASDSSSWIAASEPIGPGTSDWRHLAFDFIAPQAESAGAFAAYLSIKLKPKSDDDRSTQGTIWLDDFAITQR